MIGNHIGCSICCGAGYTINGDVCKCGSAARRLTMNTGPVVLSNEINQLRSENERLKATLGKCVIALSQCKQWQEGANMLTCHNHEAVESALAAIKEIEKWTTR